MNKKPDPQYKSPYGNAEEDRSSINTSEDDSDFDNYWNKEGVFEYESDKRDEYHSMLEAIDVETDPPQPESNDADNSEHDQEYDESYQQWASDEARRYDEIDQEIENIA